MVIFMCTWVYVVDENTALGHFLNERLFGRGFLLCIYCIGLKKEKKTLCMLSGISGTGAKRTLPGSVDCGIRRRCRTGRL